MYFYTVAGCKAVVKRYHKKTPQPLVGRSGRCLLVPLHFIMSTTEELLSFVQQMPEGFAYAPIYAAGQNLESGKPTKGKTPKEDSHHRVMTPADVALAITKRPDVFQAVGVFTGPRSKGLVILDVDRNLSALLSKWGETLTTAPVIKSTKANGAKYLFLVPEDMWGDVKGFGLSESGAGYEVLWGRQGVLFGAYPGSTTYKTPPGAYGFEGDLHQIPVVPGWLLSEMRAAKASPVTSGFVKNRKALQLEGRTNDEIAEIVQECLNVIPQQGIGSHDHWIKIGMAIHSALPIDLGLTLWSAWSCEDPEYSDQWGDKNPCEDRWNSFKPGGGINFGTLIWLADQQDPARRRFNDVQRKILEDAEAACKITRFRADVLDYESVIKRVTELQELENPAEMAHKMNALALEAGYRDAGALERLIIAHIQFQQQDDDMTIGSLIDKDIKLEYLIPDLLPMPGVVMIHGAGGDGKSMTAWTIAKHVARGLPFSIRGNDVPVQKGGVLILNGDQSEVQVKQQMMELELGHDDPIRVVMGWDLNWYLRFVKLINKHKPALVIIDSITGCSRGSAFDENKKEFAGPIYWLANNNGRLFPACSILLIHHSNKAGGFRGTTALRDAVDEVWSLRKPSDKEVERLGPSTRLISIDKSRAGRGGSKLLLKMLDDLTFELRDCIEMVEESSSPASVVDRVLQRLITASKAGEGRTRADLNADPLCGGSVGGIKKALQRLEARGLIFSTQEVNPDRPSSTLNRYFALLSRDIYRICVSPFKKASQGLETDGGQGLGVSPLFLEKEEGHGAANESEVEELEKSGAKTQIEVGQQKGCPPSLPSVDAVSARGDNFSLTPHREPAKNLRTDAEILQLKQSAGDFWNTHNDGA